MQPLTHLGLGLDSVDYEFFSKDPETYEILERRAEEMLESAKKEYMGHYYDNPPAPTQKELQEDLEQQMKRLERLRNLNAPSVIIEGVEEIITQVYFQIENKQYGKMSDPVYKKYRKSYHDKENAWMKSDEREKLIEEIQQYNEMQWEKIKGGNRPGLES